MLAHALNQGGWFGPAHESEVRSAAAEPDEATRATRIETLLAEETRMGMLVGVAVGWELARELGNTKRTWRRLNGHPLSGPCLLRADRTATRACSSTRS